MKKLMVLAMIATLLMAGAAFAAPGKLQVAPNATFAFGVIPPGGSAAAAAGPTTTNNDDSCDIGVTPAATLLLPYFEVDITSNATTAQTTLFTITNVSDVPQIAKVTIWTDFSFPVLDFNLFLTGYDVQAINLSDVFVRGFIASQVGTSIAVTPGSLSLANNSNPNFASTVATGCAPGVLPGLIPGGLLADVRTGLTTGLVSGCGATRIGGTHANAIGYATIDVVNNCTTTLPTSGTYYANEILFDNVLIGDYQQINPNPTTGNYAGGNPLVHIRAIPEGGPAGSTPTVGTVPTNFPYTFYTRYDLNAGNAINFRDRRQPLPSSFAARYIQGGTGAFNTNYKIWREGREGSGACATVNPANSTIPLAEIVRFDEHENPTTFAPGVVISPGIVQNITLPETSNNSTSNISLFPPMSQVAGDVAGWMYLNLNSGSTFPAGVNNLNTAVHPTFPNPRPSQNYVIVSMFAEGRYSVDFDSAWLGNGCSPASATSFANNGAVPIGPSGGTLVCPPGFTGGVPAPCVAGVGLYTGTNTTP